MVVICSIELERNYKDAPDERLCNCEQLSAFVFPNMGAPEGTGTSLALREMHSRMATSSARLSRNRSGYRRAGGAALFVGRRQ
jgi:hypothetical protein